jgi:hypothetical protein
MLKNIILPRLPHDIRRGLYSVIKRDWYTLLQERRTSDQMYSCRPFDQTRSIFIHMPKAAGISVCQALYGNLANGHAPIGEYQFIFPKADFDAYFKFTFARNPWDRLHSAYVFLKKGGTCDIDRRFGESLPNSFEDFVQRLTPKSIYSYVHLVPQTDFLRSYTGKELAVDFVGRFENLEQDFEKVRQRVNPAARLEHRNKTSGRTDYREAYTPKMIDIVRSVYEKDVEILGYAF